MTACVYTVLLGGYERLNEQPLASLSTWPFICLTDDPELVSETWQIRLIEPVLPADMPRSQRQPKLLPHEHLGEFDASLYIDNAVILKAPPEHIAAQWAGSSGLSMCQHSFRETLLDEFLEVLKLGLDAPDRVLEWMNHLALQQPQVLSRRPLWAGMMLRDHHDPVVRRAMVNWYQFVLRYSRRDQLSAWSAFEAAGLTPDVQQVDNHEADSHRWPVARGRDRQAARFDPVALSLPNLALVRRLEQELQALSHDKASLEAERSALGSLLQDREAENGRLTLALETLHQQVARQTERTWFAVPKPKVLRRSR